MEVARTLSLNQIGAPKARLAKVMPLSIKYIHTCSFPGFHFGCATVQKKDSVSEGATQISVNTKFNSLDFNNDTCQLFIAESEWFGLLALK